jgi:excisionase family DNA binding protein
MERITFDQLPGMVALILEKLERLESLLVPGEKIELSPVKEMLTLIEAAEFMGVSKSTLYKMSYNRALPIFKPTGGRIYFKRDDILNYLQQNRIKSNKEIEEAATNYLINHNAKRRAGRFK